jgi:hypothetical protein
LVLNLDPPNLSLPGCKDDRCEAWHREPPTRRFYNAVTGSDVRGTDGVTARWQLAVLYTRISEGFTRKVAQQGISRGGREGQGHGGRALLAADLGAGVPAKGGTAPGRCQVCGFQQLSGRKQGPEDWGQGRSCLQLEAGGRNSPGVPPWSQLT